MECPRVFSGCPNETIHSAAPHSINLPVNATLFAPHRQVPSVLRNAGMLLGSLQSATRDKCRYSGSHAAVTGYDSNCVSRNYYSSTGLRHLGIRYYSDNENTE